MILSIFLKGKEFHIFYGELEKVYTVQETHALADNIPLFISEIMSQSSLDNLEQVIYSSGPCSFTNIRIINSIVKAFRISSPNIKFLGLSHFLTYLSIAHTFSPRGLIAIPTMRVDYFTAKYEKDKLEEIVIQNIEQDYSVIFENSKCFENINLAKQQYGLLDSRILISNPQFMNTSLDINYGFTPQYSYSAS